MVDVGTTSSTVHSSRLGTSSDAYLSETGQPVRAPYSKDRVRWGPIIAGLFGTLSVLTVLSVLGLAIGLSTVDRNSDPGNYGLGAGIWGAISALIAFAFGGWLAARSSAVVGGGSNGLLQGAMVWMVTIGLLAYMVAGGVGSIMRTTADAATRTTANVAGERLGNPNAGPNAANPGANANDPLTNAGNTASQVTENIRNSVSGEDVERAAGNSARAAWGTLISMLLGLAAAAGGGFLGSRVKDHDDDHDTRISDYNRTGTPVAATR